ncbi:MAG: hypothetical protein OEZ09_01425 [Betaproteobacteria bacterium]|nr:hypothetical protein [Betaproteobacteria bacterium]MDH4322535.1 hypothetical protein [Betaproteobacteria bacterium]MDH5577094.1 hypothetical protein [Betaproteobacteria bacterium]
MTESFRNLDAIESGYTVFEKDQVLTPEQLNGLAGYLDDQERLSRVALLGVGIACGLWPSLQGKRVRLSQGVGTTTDGDLVFLPEPTFYDRYKPYDSSAPKYDPFYHGTQMIRVYELVREGESDSRALPLSGFEAREGEPPESLAAVLYVESTLRDEDLCTGTDCDNRGKDSVHTLKLLLVERKNAAGLAAPLDTPDGAARRLPEPVVAARVVLQGVNTEAELAALYRKACAATHARLVTTLEGLYAPCKAFLQDLAPVDPAPRWRATLEKIQSGIKDRGIQYYYDFLKDLAETYNAFREALFGDSAVCCPDVDAFPKHLVLGSLDPALRSAAERIGFFPSPMVSDRVERRAQARFLIRKIDTLIASFVLPATAQDIRITPSAFEDRRLEERAIPFYYALREDLPVYRAWSYVLWRRGMERHNYSWHAASYGAAGAAADPLAAQIGAFDFFRIEGHLGWDARKAAALLRDQIRQRNLPIDVETVLIGKERKHVVFDRPHRFLELYRVRHLMRADIAAGASEANEYGKAFANQITAAAGKEIKDEDVGPNVSLVQYASAQRDALGGQAAKVKEKLGKAGYAAVPDWLTEVNGTAELIVQWRDKLAPVTKDNYISPFDSFLGGPQKRWLAGFDELIRDAEEKEADRLLLAAYLGEHPGLEHCAGVLRGGTFVLVHDESQVVVADFMLPYQCCERRDAPAPLPPLTLPPFFPPLKLPTGEPPLVKFPPIRLMPLPDKAGLEKLRLDLVAKVQSDVQLHLKYFDAFKDAVAATKGTGAATPAGVRTDFADPLLNLRVAETNYRTQEVDRLRTNLLDPGIDEQTRTNVEKELEAAQENLATAIVNTTEYVASKNLDVTPGTEGAQVLAIASGSFAKVTNTTTLANVEKSLSALATRPTIKPQIAGTINNMLLARGQW